VSTNQKKTSSKKSSDKKKSTLPESKSESKKAKVKTTAIYQVKSKSATGKKQVKNKTNKTMNKPVTTKDKKNSTKSNKKVKSNKSSTLKKGKKSENVVLIDDGKQTLRVEKLQKKYGRRLVVKDVSFQITQGEVVGLLGPNGAGKTTSFYMTVGLVKQTGGKIFLSDKEITDLPMYVRARSGIGYLAQEPSIFRKLTVRQNIESILQIRKLSLSEIKSITDNLLSEFDVMHVQNQFGMTLSGGERRRVEIARTLASNPKFILLDEPFAGVDPIAVGEIQRIISHLKERNLGILITDHNVRETLSITDRAYIMHDGNVLIEGDAKTLINNPKAREIYLGENFKL